ncbi:RhuM family protein [Nocardia noduli]|uniref:RhuM family protein n=1 Tax=Nocardia noduli TaxID=2815722 RepID=UPI0020B30E1E|nr:RhuM family protein [Nocardia noduli]
MGLTSWKGKAVRKGDVDIAKNYLTEAEAAQLARLTTMFLDYAEDRAERREQTLMADWVTMTDKFLQFNERRVLHGPGSVSGANASEIAVTAYSEFDARRRAEEDAVAGIAELETIQAEIENRK